MKKQHSLTAYLLIGLGIFFLLKQLKIPILTDFYSWQTLLIIIGLALLLQGFISKNYQNIFSGTVVLGIGIHLHGLKYYSFWSDHWAVYVLIVGIAFLVRATKTKKGYFLGFTLIILSILFIFSSLIPISLYWVNDIVSLIERFWPVALIIIGIILLKKK